MSKNTELQVALQQLERRVAKLDGEDALNVIDAAICHPDNSSYRAHFEVYKAGFLWSTGEQWEAVALLERCVAEFPEIDSAHYFAGEYLLELGQFARGLKHLSRCLEISEEANDGWFEDSARLLRAYCAAKLGRIELARQDLHLLGNEESMEWIGVEPIVSKSSIEKMLASG